MQTTKLDLKLYATPTPGAALPQPDELIPIFHRWIQKQRLNELMIDVADYSHVPQGPGILLICHGAHYSYDQGPDGVGLLYSRRRPPPSEKTQQSFGESFRFVLQRTLEAALLLEQEQSLAGRLRFPADRFKLWINDRLAARCDSVDRERVLAKTREVTRELLSNATISSAPEDPRERLAIEVQAGESLTVATLLERLRSLRADVAV